MLLDPRNSTAFDLPRARRPRRLYVVASTPRTGSTLLCRSLWDIGLVGAPKEYLNPMQLRDWEVRLGSPRSALAHRLLRGEALALLGRSSWDDARMERHLERVMARRTSANGWFGLKIHAHHHRQWFAVRSLEERYGPVRWIQIRREDKLAQAISWERAIQTGRWAAHQGGSSRVATYTREAIAKRLHDIRRDEQWWDDHLGDTPVLDLSYERLVSHRVGVVRQVLEWLEVEGAASVGLPEQAPLAPMPDRGNEIWASRYRAGL